MTKTLKNNLFGEIYTEIDWEEGKLRLYWDQQNGPGTLDNCSHQTVPFSTGLPLTKGSIITAPISDRATLHVTITGKDEGLAEFHIRLSEEDMRDDANFFCPVCGKDGSHTAFPPVAMQMDKRGEYASTDGVIETIDEPTNEVHCNACTFQATKLFFDSSIWEELAA